MNRKKKEKKKKKTRNATRSQNLFKLDIKFYF